MTMKNVFKSVIEQEKYSLPDMINKIDKHHINGNLSDEDRNELISMARQRASAEHSTKVFEKLVELEKRIAELEAKNNLSESEAPEEYTVGKWYHNGDKVMYNGKIYTCIAPEGEVCVWSPTEYPAYWN